MSGPARDAIREMLSGWWPSAFERLKDVVEQDRAGAAIELKKAGATMTDPKELMAPGSFTPRLNSLIGRLDRLARPPI